MPSHSKIRVVICNRYRLFREGLKALLGPSGDIEVIGEARTARQVLRLVQRFHPDVVLVDAAASDGHGTELIQRLKALDPHLKTLVLSLYDDEHLVSDFINAGAAGYIRKGAQSEQLERAIHNACRGATFAA